MEILSVNLARAIWLGPVLDFNPKGLNLYPILFPPLVATYGFTKFPSVTEPVDLTKGVTFEGGQFEVGEERPIVIRFTIYNDGFIADSASSTTYSDAFLVDVFNLFSQLYNIPDYRTVITRRVYLSHIYCRPAKPLSFVNPKLMPISSYLSEHVEQHSFSFDIGGIEFWSDQVVKLPSAPFKLERALGVPFSENRYFSVAPLPTEKHIKLLHMLEDILS